MGNATTILILMFVILAGVGFIVPIIDSEFTENTNSRERDALQNTENFNPDDGFPSIFEIGASVILTIFWSPITDVPEFIDVFLWILRIIGLICIAAIIRGV